MTNLGTSKYSYVRASSQDSYPGLLPRLFVSDHHGPFVIKATGGFVAISPVLPLLFKPIPALVISYHSPIGTGSTLMFASSFLVL